MARILVVADNEENWDMISRRLQRRGYLVVRAADGQEAVEGIFLAGLLGFVTGNKIRR